MSAAPQLSVGSTRYEHRTQSEHRVRSEHRVLSEHRAITSAASALGFSVTRLVPVALGRTGVHRVQVFSVPGGGWSADRRLSLPTIGAVLAAKVPSGPSRILDRVHRVVWDLSVRGVPVAAPAHQGLVATPWGRVGFWQWLDTAQITPEQWGHLTGDFHRTVGSSASAHRYRPAAVFPARMRRVDELVSQRGHPLFGAHKLVRELTVALGDAVVQAEMAAAEASSLLVHGDNQPGNVMSGPAGLVFNDFERLVVGPAALDLAAVVLGMQHYGWPDSVGEEFRSGYGPHAPTLAQAAPFARIRELSGIVIAMIAAGDDNAMEEQMRIRVEAIADPGGGAQWSFVEHRPTTVLLCSKTTLAGAGIQDVGQLCPR